MEISGIEIIKSDERGIVLGCGTMNYVARKKGSISGDHTHNEDEVLYLVKGSAQVTAGDKTMRVEAPAKITIPNGEYHKIFALAHVVFLEVPRK